MTRVHRKVVQKNNPFETIFSHLKTYMNSSLDKHFSTFVLHGIFLKNPIGTCRMVDEVIINFEKVNFAKSNHNFMPISPLKS